jgi:hypothetical protein
MIIEIKELMPSEQYLVDLTNTELSEVNGGYLPFVGYEIGAFDAATVSSEIINEDANDSYTYDVQASYGVSDGTIQRGISIANNVGGGIYTPLALFYNLQG